MPLGWLCSLPIALPLFVAALLAGVGRACPRRVADVATITTVLVVLAANAVLLKIALGAPLVEWHGGWIPRNGLAIGIAFDIDGFGAALAILASFLTLWALVYSLHYFDTAGSLFHALLLILLAGLEGLAMSGDLFNVFVFLELMNTAAIALCGYKTEEPPPLQGAINFGVTNTLGAFLVLTGIALLYGRTGALNMADIGHALAAQPTDRLAGLAFVFVTAGLLVKAAIVPFHFWLADAHAVAPTPICVLLSGALVSAGMYATARVYTTVFAGALGDQTAVLSSMFVGLGLLTGAVGSVLCLAQRHLKRMLAFSTVAHMGLVLSAAALSSRHTVSGVAFYVAGHGLTKGALFLIAGMVLHRLRHIDALKLRGRGRRLPVVGFLFVLGGLLLAGLPLSAMNVGHAAMDEAARSSGHAWASYAWDAIAVITGGAVIRAALRIFLGWGPDFDIDTPHGSTDEPPETQGPHRRIPWTMMLPPVILLATSLAVGAFGVLRAPSARSDLATGFIRASLAIAFAVIALGRQAEPSAWRLRLMKAAARGIEPIRALHSGHVGDYVAWLVLGVTVLGGSMAFLY